MVIPSETAMTKRVQETAGEPQVVVVEITAEAKQGDNCDTRSNASDSEERDTLRADALRRRISPTGSMDDTYLRELLGSSLSVDSPSARSHVRRSKSCGVNGRQTDAEAKGSSYRLRIGYSDEKLRERCERNTQQLLQTALDEASANSNSAILARKALRYRKILQRMEETNVDVNDPAFDVSECMGVRWQRVASE